MRVSVLIPAAGTSNRFGEGDKLAQDLGGRALLLRTVELFGPRDEVTEIIVAGPPGEAFAAFKEKFGPTLAFHGAVIVEGSARARGETVARALDAVADDATHIAIHDAARPGPSKSLLDRAFAAAAIHDAVAPGLSITATVKRVTSTVDEADDGSDDAIADSILGDAGKEVIRTRQVVETIDRANLIDTQTPQVFAADLLRRAFTEGDATNVTDEAMLVEHLGEPVHIVEGEPRNFKITTKPDLELMRAVLGLKAPPERAVHKRF